MPRREIDDAVHERGGARMMGEVAEERGLADAGPAAQLDGKTGVERRERRGGFRSTIDEAAKRSGPQHDRSGMRTKVGALGSAGFADRRAAGLANLQHEATDGDLPGRLGVDRGLTGRVRVGARDGWGLIWPDEVQAEFHLTRP